MAVADLAQDLELLVIGLGCHFDKSKIFSGMVGKTESLSHLGVEAIL